jgi:SP family general alpha glucoside:H+ symporter-like MFS transporter
MLNPTAGNWRGKSLSIGVTFLSSTLSGPFFYLPETKDKTNEELGILFARRVNTREFGKHRDNA